MDELSRIDHNDELAAWAQRTLKLKATLIAEDEQIIEAAFATKLDRVETRDAKAGNKPSALAQSVSRQPDVEEANSQQAGEAPRKIDKSVLAFPEPRRVRDKEHLKFVSRQPCLVCARTPSDAHHLRFAQPRALGRKVSDEFTVPLCRTHHRELHRIGNETSWWARHRIEPMPQARRLWLATHPCGAAPDDSAT